MHGSIAVYVGHDVQIQEQLTQHLTSEGISLRQIAAETEGGLSFDAPTVAFLDTVGWTPGAVMPRLTHLDEFSVPWIAVSRSSDVRQVVRSMQAGAIDYLLFPLQGDDLSHATRLGIQESRRLLEKAKERQAARSLLSSLTARELEVMEKVVDGLMNKQISTSLSISEKTVEAHRHRLMHKLGMKSTVELVRFASKYLLDSTGKFVPDRLLVPRYVRGDVS